MLSVRNVVLGPDDVGLGDATLAIVLVLCNIGLILVHLDLFFVDLLLRAVTAILQLLGSKADCYIRGTHRSRQAIIIFERLIFIPGDFEVQIQDTEASLKLIDCDLAFFANIFHHLDEFSFLSERALG